MSNKKNKQLVLVTGGSGFLGVNLIRYLLKKGYAIRSIDKVEFDYPDCMRKIDVITGDIRDVPLVNKTMKGVDYVVHCAAALPLYSELEIMTTDVDGTKNLLEAAKKERVKRFVHISSTAVYGIPDHHPLVETDKLDGVGPYGKAKIMAEEACGEYRKLGMIVPIIRPKSFVGPERLGVFALFYDWASTGHGFAMIGNGNNRYQLLDVDDLCDAIFATLTLGEKKVNDTFNIGAAQYTTMKEDYQAVLDKAGFGKKITGFPAEPVIWALRVLEAMKLSPLYKWVYETAAKDSFVSIDKAVKVLGFKPKYSNKQALIRNYEWYLENKHKFAGQSGVTHRVPWNQGVLGLVKQLF
jgi:nucleoside-diphosphate-sugar epimerase